MFRTDTPSHKYALSYWVSEANNWAHLHGYDGTVEAGYLATVLAHSDICFTPGAPNHGFVWELGLSPYQGRPATDRWRTVLETAQLLPPTPPPRFPHLTPPAWRRRAFTRKTLTAE
jgi:hypothetical protein